MEWERGTEWERGRGSEGERVVKGGGREEGERDDGLYDKNCLRVIMFAVDVVRS